MNPIIGISRQTYLSMGTYLCIILFRSSSLLSAAAAAVCVMLVQAAAYLILPVLARQSDKKLLIYVSVLLSAVMGVLIYRLYGMLPINIITKSFLPLQNPVFLLILVPLLIDQAKSPDKYPLRLAWQQAGLFTGMILLVSFIREITGFGTLLGIRVIPEGLLLLPLMTHATGASFLLLLLILAALYLYRRITGTRRVLSVLEAPGQYPRQPVLYRKKELEYLYSALFSLLFTAPVMIGLYLLTVFVLPADTSFDIILLLAIVLQGISLALLHLLSGRNGPNFSRIILLPWLIPVQTIVLVIPFSQEIKAFVMGKGLLSGSIGLLLYLVCSWILAVIFLLFIRSVKRRLLFGNRPEILSGLPLLLLLTSLGLMVLTGFAAIPYNIILH